jgi:hypothetical protein
MNYKRTATIGVVGGALAAWLAAANTSDVRVAPAPIVRPTPIEQSGAALASEIAKLHERLRPTAAPRPDGRNLFEFSTSRSVAAPQGRPATPRPPVALLPAPDPPPPFTLAGMAEDTGPDGPLRTAIISSPGELFLVKEGDMVTPRYRVARISADVVELLDVATNATLRLALP